MLFWSHFFQLFFRKVQNQLVSSVASDMQFHRYTDAGFSCGDISADTIRSDKLSLNSIHAGNLINNSISR